MSENYVFLESKANIGSSLKVAYIRKCYHEEKDLDYYQAIFPGGRIIWGIFENKDYDKEVEGIKNGDEKYTQYYKHEYSVPKYHIYRNSIKIGTALPRLAHEHDDKPFLYIPETAKRNRRLHKKPGIGMDYYIFDIDENHLITEESSLLRFMN